MDEQDREVDAALGEGTGDGLEDAVLGSVSVELDHDRTVVRMTGEVDAALRAEASSSMAAALVTGLPIVVDATRLTFVDSSGLAFVLQLHLAAGESGIALSLRDPHRVLRDVLEMVGLSDEIPDDRGRDHGAAARDGAAPGTGTDESPDEVGPALLSR